MRSRIHRSIPLFHAACCLLAAALVGTAGETSRAPAFADVFGSGMVLPHGRPFSLQGTAAANARLTLTVDGATHHLRSNARGEWRLQLPPLAAGGPYTLALADERGAGTTLSNVLAGEVWLCSGQSNMEYSVSASIDQPADAAQGHDAIRLLSVAHQTALESRSTFAERPAWQIATTDAARRFSAVCYFFARGRIQDTGVPIGLINASWGGSAIQPWIGENAMAKLPGYREQVQQLRRFRSEPRQAELQFAADWVKWWRSSSSMGEVWQQGVLDGKADWQAAALADWRTYSDPRLKEFTGNLWFSASFELTEAQSRKGASFVLGKIDEVDTTWLNGRFVGNTFGYGSRREYALDPGMLKAGRNQFSVFVTNTYGAGGMTGPEEDVGIRFADGEFLRLGDAWQYRIVPKQTGYPPRAPWESVSGISGMFNGMVAPLQPLTPDGVIWYQGESNADNAAEYQSLLGTLVQDWRTFFGSNLPFLIVQLPNYGAITSAPAESGWAVMRHAQQQVALRDEKVGLVVTQDVGDDADIHPRRKYVVAQRAVQVARALQGSGVQDGVVARLAASTPQRLTLDFQPVLTAAEAARPIAGFSLCAATSGSCINAPATQRGTLIEIDRSALPAATRLRYCWSDGGSCALQTLAGLPASSFEMPLR